MISVLRAADRVAVPWKNGGGVTREVAISPLGSSFENFDWRVSIAEVHEAGPFSRFENIDRTLTILDGRILLTFKNKKVELGRDSAPLIFAGDAFCTGEPIGGSVTDLNVMTRRGRSKAGVTLVANETHQSSAKVTLLVARTETIIRQAGYSFRLKPCDAFLADEPCDLELQGEAFVIAID